MLRRVLALALAAAFIWPGAAVAQEDDGPPPMLMISSWKCDFGNMDEVGEDWDMRGLNAAQSAVDNSSWNAAGVFYHAWADEWNVNYWAVAEDIPALLEGQSANNSAYDDMYPDTPDQWDWCGEHKDSFYQLGQSTEGDDEEDDDDAPGMMAISSWKCTDVGAVSEAWEGNYLAKAQAVVDAGQWGGAGVFYHSWADEWNVNFYYFGEDIPAILEGWQAYTDSFSEGDPDLTDWCSEHKDGLYQFGESADSSDEEGEGS
jgi:hypothetical protein